MMINISGVYKQKGGQFYSSTGYCTDLKYLQSNPPQNHEKGEVTLHWIKGALHSEDTVQLWRDQSVGEGVSWQVTTPFSKQGTHKKVYDSPFPSIILKGAGMCTHTYNKPLQFSSFFLSLTSWSSVTSRTHKSPGMPGQDSFERLKLLCKTELKQSSRTFVVPLMSCMLSGIRKQQAKLSDISSKQILCGFHVLLSQYHQCCDWFSKNPTCFQEQHFHFTCHVCGECAAAELNCIKVKYVTPENQLLPSLNSLSHTYVLLH